MTRLRSATVRVPASTSNLGAGFDCLGLALDRHLTAGFAPGDGALRVVRDWGTPDDDDGPGRDLVSETFVARLRELGVSAPAGTLRVRSTIPVGRGLGSSGAALVAGLALAELVTGPPGHVPDRRALLERAAAAEGHPDNVAASVLGGLVAATPAGGDVSWHAFRLPLSARVGFAFAAPAGQVASRDARRALPETVPHATSARALGRLAALLRGLATGDGVTLALGLEDELHVPYRLPLIPGAREAIAAAAAAGAWGATVSGSGSGVIALCEPGKAEAVSAAMAAAFRASSSGDAIHFPARPIFQGVQTRPAPPVPPLVTS